MTDGCGWRQVPSGNVLVDVPKGMKPGQTFVLDLKQAPTELAAGARQQALVQQLPKARKVSDCGSCSI